MKTSIFAQIIISYAVLLTLILFIGLFNYYKLDRSISGYDNLLNNSQVVDEIRSMQVDFKKQVQEWKNILIRGHVPEDFGKYSQNFQAQYNMTRKRGDKLLTLNLSEVDLAVLNQFLTAHEQLQQEYLEALKLFTASGYTQYKTTDRMVRGKDRAPTDLLDTLTENIASSVNASREVIQSDAKSIKIITMAVLIITLLVATLLSIFLAFTISRLYSKQE